jgi:hypothetical protein
VKIGVVLMELAEIVGSEKIDNKKVKEEFENSKYKEDMLLANAKEVGEDE